MKTHQEIVKHEVTSANQRTPRNADNYQKLKDARNDLPLEQSERVKP